MFQKVLRMWMMIVFAAIAMALFFSMTDILKPYKVFTIVSIFLFASLSLMLITLGKRALGSLNNYTFVNVVMGYMTGKMFICATAIFIYAFFQRPHVLYFLIPAGIYYLVFTVYEVWAMSILQKEK